MLLLLHGKETFLARARLGELKESAQKAGAFIKDIDCAETNPREVLSELNTSSLFGSKNFFVFREPFAAKEWEEKWAQDILLKSDPHTLVFFAKEAKKTHPLFLLVAKNGEVEEFAKAKPSQLRSLVHQEVQRHGVSIAPRAQELLIALCGEDGERIAKEAAKLATFKAFSPQKNVSEEDVQSLVVGDPAPKIFDTIDAMAAKDRRQTMGRLAQHFAKGEEPLRLLSLFAWQLRILLSLKDLQERGISQREAAAKLKLHPFVVHKSFATLERFSLQELKDLYKRIFALDLAFKTGKGDPEQLLYLFLGQASAKEK